jgi:pSer/pThr/pTyr-binding forkhead associated (FHA) protein
MPDGALIGVLACDGPDEVLLGRARDCDVRIGDLSVSRSHASIHWDAQQGAHMLVDRGSANGTFIDGVRVSNAVALDDGALVRFGGLDLRYLLIRPPH